MAAAPCSLLHLSLPKHHLNLQPNPPSHSAAALPRLRSLSLGGTRPGLLPAAAPCRRAPGDVVLALSSGYNVQVVVGEDEPDEALLRRFRREVTRAGVIQECKRRRFFENKQEERKRKAREAGRRNRRRRYGPRTGFSSTASNTSPKKPADDGEDNWELPEGDLPF